MTCKIFHYKGVKCCEFRVQNVKKEFLFVLKNRPLKIFSHINHLRKMNVRIIIDNVNVRKGGRGCEKEGGEVRGRDGAQGEWVVGRGVRGE